MKALTIRQPWATCIALGTKALENRSWQTGHRGLIAIHAAAKPERDGIDVLPAVTLPPLPALRDMPLGAVIAAAELVSIHATAFPGRKCCPSPWAISGMWHWQLASVRKLAETVPCKGALGLWTLPADVEAAVMSQLNDPARSAG